VNREGSDIEIGRWWSLVMLFVVIEALVLLFWWLSQALDPADLRASLTPFSTFNVGTVLVQGGVVLAILLVFNRRLGRPFKSADDA
jgi:hypothetical protein